MSDEGLDKEEGAVKIYLVEVVHEVGGRRLADHVNVEACCPFKAQSLGLEHGGIVVSDSKRLVGEVNVIVHQRREDS